MNNLQTMEKSRLLYILKKYWQIYVLAIPGLVYLIINNYLPMFGLAIAFKDINFSKGIWKSPNVGFKNFEYLFKTKDAWIITRNTVLYNLAFIILDIVVAICFALFLSEMKARKTKKICQTFILLPYTISMTIVSYLVYALLSTQTGFINNTILTPLGINRIQWYTDASKWPWVLTITNLWKNVGYSMTIYYTAIVSLDEEFNDAAAVDGATIYQRIRYVTIPLLKPTIVMLTLLALGRVFYSDFGLFYQVPMNSGMLNATTNTIDTYVYRALINSNDIGMSSAAGFYQSMVGFVLVLISNTVVRHFDPDNALF